jgi:hypothetical protein
MALKEKIDLIFDDSIGATTTDIKTGAIVASGKTVRLFNFGGYDPRIGDGIDSLIVLQWGSGTSWQTVRAGGGGTFEHSWKSGQDFNGDGVKRFRLIRQNKSTSAKPIVAWMMALIVN